MRVQPGGGIPPAFLPSAAVPKARHGGDITGYRPSGDGDVRVPDFGIESLHPAGGVLK